MASSLTSVSIPATFIHATEWLHGDLGRALPGRDVVLFFSHSGNTEECVCAATHLVKKGVTTLSLTGNKDSKLSKLSVESLSYHSADVQELWGCVPTSSIVVQELLCNAVLRELIQRRGTRREAFKFNHPGGAIGAAPS